MIKNHKEGIGRMKKFIVSLVVSFALLSACSEEDRTDDYIWRVVVTENGEVTEYLAESYTLNKKNGIVRLNMYGIDGKIIGTVSGKDVVIKTEKVLK